MTGVLGQRLRALAEKEVRLVVGVMSGTSTDGVDVALVRIRGSGEQTRAEMVGFVSEPYDRALRERILRLYPPATFTAEEVANLSWDLGEVHADAVRALLDKLALAPSDVDLVGHHGVGLYHERRRHVDIAEASVIAERLGVTVVTDLRVRDCAAGGQGAPLSPYVDWILFRHDTSARALQNIGGIANVAVIPPAASLDDVISYDTGPGNMVIDGVVQIITRGEQSYDHDGRIAARGTVHEELLGELLAHPYLQREPPKCTGREEFGDHFIGALVERARRMRVADADLVATVTVFSARAMVDSYRRFIMPRGPIDEIIVGGGGVHNPVLMDHLRRLAAPIAVRTHTSYGIPDDAREALTWAVLANETIHGNAANLPGVTGARRRVVLGKIIPG